MHITIGMTLYNIMPVETFVSFNNLIFEMLTLIEKNKRVTFSLINTKGLPVDKARNNIVMQFIDQQRDSEYLLFLDADMVFPRDLVKNLLNIDADVATALAFKKWWPHYPTIYHYNGKEFKSIIDYEKKKIIEVDGCGMACCLIKREVFEKIKYPWFEFEEIKEGKYFSEDLTFCKKVKKAGFKIKVDTGLVCGHVGGIVEEKTFDGVKKLLPHQTLIGFRGGV